MFPTLGPNSLPVDESNDNQTVQLLCWSGMTYTEHSTTSGLGSIFCIFKILNLTQLFKPGMCKRLNFFGIGSTLRKEAEIGSEANSEAFDFFRPLSLPEF